MTTFRGATGTPGQGTPFPLDAGAAASVADALAQAVAAAASAAAAAQSAIDAANSAGSIGTSSLKMVESLEATAGNSSHLIRTSGFTGAANSSKWTLSFWMRPQSVPATAFMFNMNNDFTVRLTSSGVQIDGFDTAGASAVKMVSVLDVLKSHGYIHILASCDLSASPVEKHYYVNGIENNDSGLFTSVQGKTMKFLGTTTVYGNQINLSTDFLGALGGFYLNPGTFIDFSVQANREKFIDSNFLPADLGTNGETPTGSSPLIFINNTAPTVEVNLGTGGDFTVGNGPFIPHIVP